MGERDRPVVSVVDDDESLRRSLRNLLDKPFRSDGLLDAVRAALRRARSDVETLEMSRDGGYRHEP